MKSLRYAIEVVLIVAVIFITFTPSRLVFGAVATEFTQYLNFMKLVQVTINQAESIAKQIEMIKYQADSVRGLSASEWGNAVFALRQLDNIVQQGRALSYALQNVEATYRQIFPGYHPQEDYVRSYENWSETTLDSIQASLSAAGFQSRQFENEQATLQTIRHLSDGAVGQTQAIQAGNMVGNELVGQLQKLRQLHMAQLQAQAAYMSFSVEEKAANKASLEQLFQKIPYTKSNSKGY